MAIRATCYVTGSLAGGPAFAMRSDTHETVFIPSKTAERLELQETDEIVAILVPNMIAPEKTPWFAESAMRVNKD